MNGSVDSDTKILVRHESDMLVHVTVWGIHEMHLTPAMEIIKTEGFFVSVPTLDMLSMVE